MLEKSDEIMGLEKTRAKFTQILNLGQSWAYQAHVWEGLGILLGAFGHLFVVFWTLWLELFSSVGPRWAPKGLLDSFWVDLGRDLERFWEDLEGFGMVLGGIFEGFQVFWIIAFGTVLEFFLGAFGRLLVVFWTFNLQLFFQRWPKMGSFRCT